MAFKVDDYGNITLVQGDSGELTVSGIPTDKEYTVYLAVQDNNRKPVGFEVKVNSGGQESIVFKFTPQLTNYFTVKKNEETAEYYYGVKVCDENEGRTYDYEDTLLIGDSQIGDLNTITVYPKKVEGKENIISND